MAVKLQVAVQRSAANAWVASTLKRLLESQSQQGCFTPLCDSMHSKSSVFLTKTMTTNSVLSNSSPVVSVLKRLSFIEIKQRFVWINCVFRFYLHLYGLSLKPQITCNWSLIKFSTAPLPKQYALGLENLLRNLHC